MTRALSFVLAISVLFGTGAAQAQAITVDLAERHQVVEGFGGFGPAKVWWESAPYFDEAYLARVVDELGASIVRTQLFWDFEPTNDNADPNDLDLTGFDYGPESDNGKQFDFLRALDARGVRVIASVWTPPVFMKLDPDDGLAPFCDGQCGGRLNPAMREEFAEYLVAYIRVLRQEAGVDLYGISLQNELLFPNPFESCVYTAEEFAATLAIVGARFDAEGITTRIFGPEHMGSYEWNTSANLFATLLDDPDVSRHLDVYAVHSYLDGFTPDFSNPEGWTNIASRVEAAGKPLWMTETSGDVASYDAAFEMTRGLYLALRHGNVTAWIYWYMAGSLLVDGQPTSLFHLLQSYFKYVRPGARRVTATATDARLLVTAFAEREALTVVVMNDSDVPVTTALAVSGGAAYTRFRRHRTSETEDFVDLGESELGAIELPPRSITTLVAGEPDGEPLPGPTSSRAAGGCGCSIGGAGAPGSAALAFALLGLLVVVARRGSHSV